MPFQTLIPNPPTRRLFALRWVATTLVLAGFTLGGFTLHRVLPQRQAKTIASPLERDLDRLLGAQEPAAVTAANQACAESPSRDYGSEPPADWITFAVANSDPAIQMRHPADWDAHSEDGGLQFWGGTDGGGASVFVKPFDLSAASAADVVGASLDVMTTNLNGFKVRELKAVRMAAGAGCRLRYSEDTAAGGATSDMIIIDTDAGGYSIQVSVDERAPDSLRAEAEAVAASLQVSVR